MGIEEQDNGYGGLGSPGEQYLSDIYRTIDDREALKHAIEQFPEGWKLFVYRITEWPRTFRECLRLLWGFDAWFSIGGVCIPFYKTMFLLNLAVIAFTLLARRYM